MFLKTKYYTLSDVFTSEATFKSLTVQVNVSDSDAKTWLLGSKLMENLYYYWSEYYCFCEDYDCFDIEPTIDTNTRNAISWRFTNIINNILDRYYQLFKAYEKYANDPLKDVETWTEGKSKYNDTPQSDDGETEYDVGDFTSNITSSNAHTKSEVQLVPEKLEALNKYWRRLQRDFNMEFKGLFMEVFD